MSRSFTDSAAVLVHVLAMSMLMTGTVHAAPPASAPREMHEPDVRRPSRIGGAILAGSSAAILGVGINVMFIPHQPLEMPGDRSWEPAVAALVGTSLFVIVAGAFFIADAVQRSDGPRSRGRRAGRLRLGLAFREEPTCTMQTK